MSQSAAAACAHTSDVASATPMNAAANRPTETAFAQPSMLAPKSFTVSVADQTSVWADAVALNPISAATANGRARRSVMGSTGAGRCDWLRDTPDGAAAGMGVRGGGEAFEADLSALGSYDAVTGAGLS